MTQPTFVPIAEADQVRPARHLHVPGSWMPSRPGEATNPALLRGRSIGSPGPDQGFALRLARRFEHELKLGEGETEHDALTGVALIASKRSAIFGRAPSVYDVQFALNLWGLRTDAPLALRRRRRAAFSSIAHDYVAQRQLVDSIPEEILRLSPEEARARGGEIGA